MSVQIAGQSVKTVFTAPDPSAQPFANIPALVQSIRAGHSGGVNAILVGIAQVNQFKVARDPNGIIAILIGLLLPAVQKVSMAKDSEAKLLDSVLKPGGSLGFVMADGSVRSAKPAGRRLIDCEGYAALL